MKYLVGLIVIIALAAGAFVIAGRGNDDDRSTTTEQSQTTPPPAQNPSPPSSQAAATDKVSISNFAFSPADITVKKGTKVTWTNNDSIAHTVTADSGNGPNSELLNNGQTYSFTFNQAGTFNYHCTPHPQMHGTVVVTE